MIGRLLWINGRNGRGMYWLISFGQIVVLFWLLSGAYIAAARQDQAATVKALQGIGVFTPLLIVSAWMGWINMIRRYHDRGKSGWWSLLVIAPIIGPIWQFVELGFCRGEDNVNQWGHPPGAAGRAAALDGEIAGLSGGGAMAKLDDDYMAEYARKIALQRTEEQSRETKPSFGGSGSSAPVFGKR